MVLKIRLRQQGRTNRLTYRLVVTDSRSPRDGKYVENLGHYDPHAAGEKDGAVKEDRIAHWLELGAQPTDKARAFIARKAPGALKVLRERAEAKAKKKPAKEKKEAPAAAPKKTAARKTAKKK